MASIPRLQHLLLAAACITCFILSEDATAQEMRAAPGVSPMYVTAVEGQQSPEGSAGMLAERGIAAFQQKNFKDAVRYLSEARKEDPANPLLAAALGQALMSAGEPARAVEPLEFALSSNPGDDAVRLVLAQSYQRLNQDGKVVDLLKLPSSQASPSPVWLFTLAFSQFRLGEYQDAEPIFRRLVALPGMTAGANFFVANCRFGQSDLQGSLAWYEAAIDIGNSPRNTALNAYYYNYGLALFRLRRYSDASAAFLASTKRDPGDPLPPYFLGRSQAERGELQDAISILTQLIQAHPDFSPAYYQLGRLFARTGNQARSREMFAKVRQIKDAELHEQQLLEGLELGTQHSSHGPS